MSGDGEDGGCLVPGQLGLVILWSVCVCVCVCVLGAQVKEK